LSRLPDAAAAELAAEGDVFADDKRYASQGPNGRRRHLGGARQTGERSRV